MKSYYDVKDVQEIVGVGQSMAYTIIRRLKESFKKEYPDAIQIQGRIPIWYFERIMKSKDGKGEKTND